MLRRKISAIFAAEINAMANVSAHPETAKNLTPKQLVLCPKCGQKLTDILNVEGKSELRIKCRRCRTFINIELTHNIAQ